LDVIYSIYFRCGLWTMYNLNYAPTTYGVENWKKIYLGVCEHKRLNITSLECILCVNCNTDSRTQLFYYIVVFSCQFPILISFLPMPLIYVTYILFLLLPLFCPIYLLVKPVLYPPLLFLCTFLDFISFLLCSFRLSYLSAYRHFHRRNLASRTGIGYNLYVNFPFVLNSFITDEVKYGNDSI
jgi:hypothetical protein